MDLTPTDTAVYIHPDYYVAGSERTAVRVKHLSSLIVTSSHGKNIKANYIVAEGHKLECTTVIH